MPLTKVYEYNIRKQMKRDSSVLWIGARRSGKTYSVRHCIYEMKFKRILAMAGSADCEEFHEQYIPRSYVFGEFNESKMEEIFLYQRHLKNMQKRGDNVDMELAIVIDDFGFDDKVMKSKSMTNCYQNGRNYGLWVGVTVQYGTQFPKKLRGNIDVVFIFEERSRDNRVGLYKQYTSTFSSFEQFNEYLDACTQDGRAMVIDNTVKSNKLQDKVFWYKPVFDLPRFTAGDKGFVAFDKVHYQHEEEDEMYDDSFIGMSASGNKKGSSETQSQQQRQKKQTKLSKRELMKQSLFETPLECASQFNLQTTSSCANSNEESTTNTPSAWNHLEEDNNPDFDNNVEETTLDPTGGRGGHKHNHQHKPVGMGSSLMASWKTMTGNRIQLQSNPDFHDDEPLLHETHTHIKNGLHKHSKSQYQGLMVENSTDSVVTRQSEQQSQTYVPNHQAEESTLLEHQHQPCVSGSYLQTQQTQPNYYPYQYSHPYSYPYTNHVSPLSSMPTNYGIAPQNAGFSPPLSGPAYFSQYSPDLIHHPYAQHHQIPSCFSSHSNMIEIPNSPPPSLNNFSKVNPLVGTHQVIY